MKRKNKYLRSEHGAGLMETLLAIAIVGAIMPFAYNGVVEMSNSIADAAESKRITAWHDPMMAYVRINQADWPSSAQIEFDEDEVNLIWNQEFGAQGRLLQPYAGFIEKRTQAGGAMIDVYLAFRPVDIKEVRVATIAKNLGSDAAIVGAGGEAVSSSGWSISSDVFSAGDLVFRISDILGEDESRRYLHRTYLGDDEMNTMYRDLNMAKYNLTDVGTLYANRLNATNGNIWFAEAPELQCADLYFPEGASVDPSKATFGTVRVTGDISGFRKITAKRLKGSGVLPGMTWSSRGDAVADSVNVSGSLHVQRDMTVRSESVRTASVAGVRAGALATPYLNTDQLIFATGFGMTVSSELMYSTAAAPIKLGGWSFPSLNGPKFSTLILRKIGGGDIGEMLYAPSPAEFAPIMTGGWKDR
ncbi:MAG: hypothetical protein FWF97_01400 [Alphaproteobacteria bacterium]|nr:hypothetical protein [Alphaproteobacteria bacterium]